MPISAPKPEQFIGLVYPETRTGKPNNFGFLILNIKFPHHA
jgi:hypothetical protein